MSLANYLRRKEIEKRCSKCLKREGLMKGHTQEIPMGVPYAFTLNSTINLEPYIRSKIHNYKYYAIFQCKSCGFVEFFLYNIKD
jgi:hypothetical protein